MAGSVPAQNQPAKIWRTKLDIYGWRPLPTAQHDERPGAPSRQVAIDHKGRILVGFAAREGLNLATREHPALAFHVLRITSDGQVDLSLVVPTNDYFANGLYLGPNDQIIVRANGSLNILTAPSGNPSRRAWRTVAPCGENCWIHQSPSRRILIVSESFDNRGASTVWPAPQSSYTIFDLSFPEPHAVQTCHQMAFNAEKITDKFAYWPNYDRDDNRTVRFGFCDVIHPQEVDSTSGGGFFPLTDNEFLFLDNEYRSVPGEVRLVEVGGQVKFRVELPKHDTPQYYGGFWAVSDAAGDRFAFTVDTWHGGSRFFDTSGKLIGRRVVAYSDTGQELAAVPVSTTYHRDFDFSLSPDGHRLAILDEGGVVIVYLP